MTRKDLKLVKISEVALLIELEVEHCMLEYLTLLFFNLGGQSSILALSSFICLKKAC